MALHIKLPSSAVLGSLSNIADEGVAIATRKIKELPSGEVVTPELLERLGVDEETRKNVFSLLLSDALENQQPLSYTVQKNEDGGLMVYFPEYRTEPFNVTGGLPGVISMTQSVGKGFLGFKGATNESANKPWYDSEYTVVTDEWYSEHGEEGEKVNPEKGYEQSRVLLRDALQHFEYIKNPPSGISIRQWAQLQARLIKEVQRIEEKNDCTQAPDSTGKYPMKSFCRYSREEGVWFHEWTSKFSPEYKATIALLNPTTDMTEEDVDALVKQGAILTASYEYGGSHNADALERCAAINAVDLVRSLMDRHGMKVQGKRISTTFLHTEIYDNNLEVVQYVLKNDPSLVSVRNWNQDTPLHKAASRYQTHGKYTHKPAPTNKVIEILIENGADINTVNKEGRTPLCLTITFGHPDTCQQLLDQGANVNVPDSEGINQTIKEVLNTWMLTKDSDKVKRQEIINLLLDHGLDIGDECSRYHPSVEHKPDVSVLTDGPRTYVSHVKLVLADRMPSLRLTDLVTEGSATPTYLRVCSLGLLPDLLKRINDFTDLEQSELLRLIPSHFKKKHKDQLTISPTNHELCI
jgi:hypothetical protein